MKEVCRTSNLGIRRGYVNRPGSVAVTAQLVGSGLRLNEWTGVDKETVMNQQAMRQAARRSALDVQAIRRKERADRERRLEKLAVAVLTALGDATLRFATRNAAPVRHCRWGWRSPGYANSHTTRRTAAADECLTQ
jgi:hypothetical protein